MLYKSICLGGYTRFLFGYHQQVSAQEQLNNKKGCDKKMKIKLYIGATTFVIAGLFITSAMGLSLSTQTTPEALNVDASMGIAPPVAPTHLEPLHIPTHPNDLNKGIGKIHANQPGGIIQQFTTTSTNIGILYYKFFFGDGTDSGWLGPYITGQVANTTHDYNALGNFAVTVICRNDWVESNASAPTNVRMYLLGDTRPDNIFNFGDIGPFVQILSAGKNAYYNYLPDGYYYTADISLDGLVNFGDINPFVALLTGG